MVPPDRLLIETDSPFLAPPGAPRSRNQPEWVRVTGAWAAEQSGRRPRGAGRRPRRRLRPYVPESPEDRMTRATRHHPIARDDSTLVAARPRRRGRAARSTRARPRRCATATPSRRRPTASVSPGVAPSPTASAAASPRRQPPVPPAAGGSDAIGPPDRPHGRDRRDLRSTHLRVRQLPRCPDPAGPPQGFARRARNRPTPRRGAAAAIVDRRRARPAASVHGHVAPERRREETFTGPTEVKPNFPALRHAVQFDASEGVIGWYIGYAGERLRRRSGRTATNLTRHHRSLVNTRSGLTAAPRFASLPLALSQ